MSMSFVDQREQIPSGRQDPLDAVAILLAEVGQLKQLGEAEIEFSGVRSSMTVLDRKEFLAWVARTA